MLCIFLRGALAKTEETVKTEEALKTEGNSLTRQLAWIGEAVKSEGPYLRTRPLRMNCPEERGRASSSLLFCRTSQIIGKDMGLTAKNNLQLPGFDLTATAKEYQLTQTVTKRKANYDPTEE